MPRSCCPLLVAVTLCALGCVSTEPLEHELRQKQAQISRLSQEAQTSKYNLEVCRRENEALRGQLQQQPGRQPLLPEQAAGMFSLKEITLSSRATGGLNNDNLPGDDGIQVLIEPRDGQGDVIKAPGSTQFELFDLAEPDPQRRIGFWEFSLQDTAARWQSGWLSQGYRFELPWQAGYPRHSDLTLHVRLTTPDGRPFTATRQIRIQPMPSQLPSSAPASPTIPPPQPPSPVSPVDPAIRGPALPDPSRPAAPAQPSPPPPRGPALGPSAGAAPPTSVPAPEAPAGVGFSPVRPSGFSPAQPTWQKVASRRARAPHTDTGFEQIDSSTDLAERPQRYDGPVGVPYPYHEPGRVYRY